MPSLTAVAKPWLEFSDKSVEFLEKYFLNIFGLLSVEPLSTRITSKIDFGQFEMAFLSANRHGSMKTAPL